jgi:hypothetical protein
MQAKRKVPWQCPDSRWVNVWNNDIKALSMRMAPRTIYLDCSNNDIRSLETLEGGCSLVCACGRTAAHWSCGISNMLAALNTLMCSVD